jgi:hypothetical protein
MARAGVTTERYRVKLSKEFVMPGLVPGIHDFAARAVRKTWMAASSPAMTKKLPWE